jgi:integrase
MGKKKSAGNGEGTIIPIRKNGKVTGYAAEITIGWANGKRQKVRRYTKTRPDAKRLLAELLDQYQRGVNLSLKPQTVRQYITEWIDNSLSLRARPGSIDDYRWVANACIFPHIGDILIKKLTVPHVRKLIAALHRAGYAKKTIIQARAVLRSALQEALIDDLVDRNVAVLVKPPKLERHNAKRALSLEQIAMFLQAARGERLEVALHLALFTGLRRGEICALRREDLDLEAGTLTVNGTMQYLKGRGLVYGPTKTASSQRSLKISPRLIAALRWQLRRVEVERQAMADRWQESPYLFVAATTGGPLNPGILYAAFRAVAKRAGITGFCLHDLRHTTATLLDEAGYSVAAAAAYLGHAHAGITLATYTHLFKGAIDDAAGTIEELLGVEVGGESWNEEE